MRFLFLIFAVSIPFAGFAQDKAKTIAAVVNQHILPGFTELAGSTQTLSQAANQNCSASSKHLKSAYHAAFDDWMSVSHLQFGPLETDNRGFDIAFWPDPRGFTPKALSQLINDQDPIIADAAGFSTVSVAAKGFFGLEFLLFDPKFSALGSDEYRCDLIQAVTRDLANTAATALDDWQDMHADQMLSSGPDRIYRTDDEVLRILFRSLVTGLQFTSETRLGRPLGTFDRPRPRRSEARRSARSLENLVLSLSALNDLGTLLAQDDESVALFLTVAFSRALETASTLDDPVFANVADVQGRLETEILQQEINQIRDIVSLNLGPTLGVAAGFNAMDGD